MRYPRALSLVLTLALLTACRVERAPEERAGVTAKQQRVQSVAARAISERPMAHRREGQGLLDSARTALIGGEPAPAATLLHGAAAFFLRQANDPPSGGTADLLAAAGGLDSLAMDVSRDRKADSSRLDHLSAHANLAEAERHGALAAVAWSTRSKESVSDELVMAADHVERATLDANNQCAIAQAHQALPLRRRGVHDDAAARPCGTTHVRSARGTQRTCQRLCRASLRSAR